MGHAVSLPLLALAHLLAFFCLLNHVAEADIREAWIKHDSRTYIEFLEFGFTERGKLEVEVRDFSCSSSNKTDLSKLSFLLIPEEDWEIQDLTRPFPLCSSSSRPSIHPNFTFDRLNDTNSATLSMAVSVPNEYVFVFVNCLTPLRITVHVETSAYNLGKNGKKNYLAVGENELPALYFSFAFVYFLLFLFWAYICARKRRYISKIHVLMAPLVVLKALNLVCKAEDKLHIRTSGTAHGWDVMFYTFSLLKGIMLFTVLVLIGTGWSVVKPFLQEKEKRLLMVVIPMQVMANIAMIAVEESSPSDEGSEAWSIVFVLFDTLCCVLIVLPIMGSIRLLQEASQTDGKAARSVLKLKLFRYYYLILIGYIYLTRFIPSMMIEAVPFRYSWTCELLKEIVTVMFYVFTGYSFRPEPENPYVRIDDEEDIDCNEDVASAAAEEIEL